MLHALVPVNHLDRVKTRLGLSASQSRQIVLDMLARVLDALTSVASIQSVAVICPDESVRPLSESKGAAFLSPPSGGLNPDLEWAREAARAAGADEILVVLGDLPLLRAIEIDALLERPEAVVLACDRAGKGSNMLLLRSPATLPFRFGPDSCARHLAEARAAGLSASVFRSAGTEQDLDEPEHLEILGRRKAVA